MFSDVQRRTRKVGQSPGTAIYTGKKTAQLPVMTIITFNDDDCQVIHDISPEHVTDHIA